MSNYLNEQNAGTNGPSVSNIADTDKYYPLKDVFQELQVPSLARSVFTEIKVNGPTSGVFVVTDEFEKKVNNTSIKLQLKRSNLNCFSSDPIKTTITRESLNDLSAFYGEANAKQYVARMLRNAANVQENEQLKTFLSTNAVADTNLQITMPGHAENTLFEVTDRVQKLIIQMNTIQQRTFTGWAILPYNLAASIMALYSYQTGSNNTISVSEFKIADFAMVKYYVNPDVKDKHIYVGLKSEANPFCTSAFFADYMSDIQEIEDSDTGNFTYWIYNRFGFALSPMHSKETPMLYKVPTV